MKTFKQFLQEMPMSLNFAGNNWNDLEQNAKAGQATGRFDASSTRMLHSDKAKAKIIRRFEDVPYNFNVYFVNSKRGCTSAKIDKSQMELYYPQMGITPNEAPIIDGKINVFICSWENDPPTAWMIAHRFGHANNELTQSLYKIMHQYGKNIQGIRSGYPEFDIVSRYGTMKSATTGKLGANDEPLYEIIAQFIMTGKVTFKTSPNSTIDSQIKNIESICNITIENVMKDARQYVYFLF